MANFNYEQYAAQQAARQASFDGQPRVDVHFANDYLKNDGDSIIVRFPYHSMADIEFESVHNVVFPGKRFGSPVRCDGEGCKLCAEGQPLTVRFFAKFISYHIDPATNQVMLVNTIWDRPAAFADIELKNLMQDYGDLTTHLFKIKRNGTGTSTRYSISIITNTAVYNPEFYKADFTELDTVDPRRILSKSVEQYEVACGLREAPTPAATAVSSNLAMHSSFSAASVPIPEPTQPAMTTNTSGYSAQSQAPVYQQPAAQPYPTYSQPVAPTPAAPSPAVGTTDRVQKHRF